MASKRPIEDALVPGVTEFAVLGVALMLVQEGKLSPAKLYGFLFGLAGGFVSASF